MHRRQPPLRDRARLELARDREGAEDPGDDERRERERADDEVRDVAGLVVDQVVLDRDEADAGEAVVAPRTR